MKITERGWVGHYICGDRCRFRRNTLIESNGRRVVVSTVGAMFTDDKMEAIGAGGRYYETMAFGAKDQAGYVEANVSDQLGFESPWSICASSPKKLPADVDNAANAMHDAVVAEFVAQLSEQPNARIEPGRCE